MPEILSSYLKSNFGISLSKWLEKVIHLNFVSFLIINKLWLSAGFLLALSSSFGQTFFISIFAAEIMSSFDLSNSEWGTIYASGTLLSAAAMIYIGGLVDDYKTSSPPI